MSNLPLFAAYAAAFEETLIDDNWDRLNVYFNPDATYKPGDGSHAKGREAVLLALKQSVDSLEKKCDGREILGQPGVNEDADTVTLNYSIRYTKKNAPDFILVGSETIQFADGAIANMEDIFEDPQALLDWLASH